MTAVSTVPGLNRIGTGRSDAVLEAPTLVAGLNDVAVVGEAVKQRRGHFGIAKDARPFAKREVRRHDHRGLLVEPTDQVEQQLSARLGERQVAEFIKDNEVLAIQIIRTDNPPVAPGVRTGFPPQAC